MTGVDPIIYDLFKKGSRTYFYSSAFFPPAVRKEVFVLYSFVRKADNFVDSVPQDSDGFRRFRAGYERTLSGETTGDIVLDSFAELMRRRQFDPAWVEAFLDAMELDLTKVSYESLEEVCSYMYGSAEVVGLMMAAILELPSESHHSARMLGRAMQYINFIRDIREDLELGRTYFPIRELQEFGLADLTFDQASQNEERFTEFLRKQIERYETWQQEAEAGFSYLPRRVRIPVRTASEMYKWTGRRIMREPLILYSRKVKPSVSRIVVGAGYSVLVG